MNKFSHWHAILLGVCAGISLSFFTLPLWVVGLISFTRDGNRSDWLGFVGAMIGAIATLVAAGMALFAAYRTLAPVKAQLDQLVKQNDYNLFERLSGRATSLNNEEILIQRVAANCQVLSNALEPFQGTQQITYVTSAVSAPVAALRVAVERLQDSVVEIQKQRGEVWGNTNTQGLRRRFIDVALIAAAHGLEMLTTAEGNQRMAHILLKKEIEHWKTLNKEIHEFGNQLFQLGQLESQKIGRAIAEVEQRLF
ncbi:hypothetical protein [Bradyrhizobium sp. cf659]|uniref:hypothetical protein n=1 Tax=Bradyrhizobium sp. cf659 TaxID=1761771 RepID=UPI0011604EC0|nr:hypothetical protein [Bradyrhizobium sp. cf659]